ncbi:MAG TPA: pyridoxamine 5'-phosphate oxidase family protein [Candidatus Acidoferrales bacterium]|nr:pyridoxamine 5'-phosphate oxidase family protein [Candidatus Acidoferrales bacterium]
MPANKTTGRRSAPKASRPHMPGYGLPTGSKGLLPWKWADDRLRKSHNYWVATGHPAGRPHLMIVWGLWMDGAFYFGTGRQSRKAKNLAARPQCVIATEQANQAVIVEGMAEEVQDVAFRRRYINVYEKKYNFDMSAFEKDIVSLKEPIYIVRPSVAFGLDEKKSLAAATRWRF